MSAQSGKIRKISSKKTSLLKPLQNLYCGKGTDEVFAAPSLNKLSPVQNPFCSLMFLSKLLPSGLVDTRGKGYGRENKERSDNSHCSLSL